MTQETEMNDFYRQEARWIDRGTVQWAKKGPFYPRLRMTRNQREQIYMAIAIAGICFSLLSFFL